MRLLLSIVLSTLFIFINKCQVVHTINLKLDDRLQVVKNEKGTITVGLKPEAQLRPQPKQFQWQQLFGLMPQLPQTSLTTMPKLLVKPEVDDRSNGRQMTVPDENRVVEPAIVTSSVEGSDRTSKTGNAGPKMPETVMPMTGNGGNPVSGGMVISGNNQAQIPGNDGMSIGNNNGLQTDGNNQRPTPMEGNGNSQTSVSDDAQPPILMNGNNQPSMSGIEEITNENVQLPMRENNGIPLNGNGNSQLPMRGNNGMRNNGNGGIKNSGQPPIDVNDQPLIPENGEMPMNVKGQAIEDNNGIGIDGVQNGGKPIIPLNGNDRPPKTENDQPLISINGNQTPMSETRENDNVDDQPSIPGNGDTPMSGNGQPIRDNNGIGVGGMQNGNKPAIPGNVNDQPIILTDGNNQPSIGGIDDNNNSQPPIVDNIGTEMENDGMQNGDKPMMPMNSNDRPPMGDDIQPSIPGNNEMSIGDNNGVGTGETGGMQNVGQSTLPMDGNSQPAMGENNGVRINPWLQLLPQLISSVSKSTSESHSVSRQESSLNLQSLTQPQSSLETQIPSLQQPITLNDPTPITENGQPLIPDAIPMVEPVLQPQPQLLWQQPFRLRPQLQMRPKSELQLTPELLLSSLLKLPSASNSVSQPESSLNLQPLIQPQFSLETQIPSLTQIRPKINDLTNFESNPIKIPASVVKPALPPIYQVLKQLSQLICYTVTRNGNIALNGGLSKLCDENRWSTPKVASKADLVRSLLLNRFRKFGLKI